MFCASCGKKIPDDSAFCSSCGAPVGGSVSGDGSVPKASSRQAQIGAAPVASTGAARLKAAGAAPGAKGPSPKKGLNQKTLIGVGAAVIAVLAIAVCVNLFSGSGGSKSSEPIGNAFDVVQVLTGRSDDAYAILSDLEVVVPIDIDDENPTILFESDSQAAEYRELERRAFAERKSMTDYDSYLPLSEALYKKPWYECSFVNVDKKLTEDDFQQDSMPELSYCDLKIYVPGDVELDCHTAASYIEPFILFEKAYLGQIDSDTFKGAAKGKGCISRIDIHMAEDSELEKTVWVIRVGAASISRAPRGVNSADDFDNEYDSVDSSDYIDFLKV